MGTTTGRPALQKGLDDVYVKESKICLVDGEKGRLLYVGYDIRDLAEHSSFEETCFLLWHLRLPKADELEATRRGIAEERKIPKEIHEYLKLLPRATAPMDALRTAVSALAGYDPELTDMKRDSNFRKALRLTAKFATIVAAFHRIREGKKPVPPDSELGHAEDFLRMITGKAPDPLEAKIIDVSLILHADHSTNASTFAATAAGSTLADLYAAIVAGIATLKGPLHGGANEQALKMLLKIGTPANAEPYVERVLAKKEDIGAGPGKIPGFGHRVYKNFDPRALILREYAKQLSLRRGDTTLYDTATAVQDIMLRELEVKRVYPNVDFYSGLTYYLMGLPSDLFTPVFAVSRIAGWAAHVIEYWEANRIMRPLEIYTGPTEATFVPVSRR